MYELEFCEEFDKSFSKIKDSKIRKQIYKKILELKVRVPIGKKLENCNFWRLRINQYRIIYEIKENNKIVLIIALLNRKKDYKGL